MQKVLGATFFDSDCRYRLVTVRLCRLS